MQSVSSRIMTGQVIKGGTGLCNVIMDTDKIINSEFIEDTEQKYKKTFTELSVDPLINEKIENEDVGGFIPM